jgi:endoglucanase
MKLTEFHLIIALSLTLASARADDEATTKIRLDTVGYLPGHAKKASIAAECRTFAVLDAKGNRVLEGNVTGPVTNEDTKEQLRLADFSRLEAPGLYVLEVPGVGRSATFRVGADAYREAFVTVTRAMYLWRCGAAVKGSHQRDVFAHEACHGDDAWLDYAEKRHARRDDVGGWHDAGDYNKYVVNAGVTVGAMLRAWEDFGPRLRGIGLDLPESSNATPDFLDEIRWELEWLLKMQAADGSVYHKLSTLKFGGFVMPEQEATPRYLTPWGSAATADFVAMTAQAARVFRPFDPAFADRCLGAAKKSAAFLRAHPDDHRPDLKAFSTGAYQTRDPDDRLWAAAELWETTGDDDALRDLEARVEKVGGLVDRDFDWGEVKNLGLITYLRSQRTGRDEALVGKVKACLLATADVIVEAAARHGYARPLGTRYYWGCNGSVARQTLLLTAAHRVEPKPAYAATALDALHHLLGRNPFGRSYVTGVGFRPPLHPHDRRSGADRIDAPWPGYLVGGPNRNATDWHDDQADYRTNEIAINWNGALIYALAAFQEAP